MTHEEAIAELRIDRQPGDLILAQAIAIEALKKQIPMEPFSNHVEPSLYCPACRKRLRTFITVEDSRFLDGTYERIAIYPKFCDDCGQAIKWPEKKK